MTAVAVVSALYGGYDDPVLHVEQDLEAERVFVTDESQLAGNYSAYGATGVYEPRVDVHPRLAAKVPKCLPWEYADAEVYVWMDASCRLVREDSLRWVVEQALLSVDGITQFRHPWRNCFFDEAEESARLAKYAGRPVLEQARSYRDRGMPSAWGLWATGLIAYKVTRSRRKRLDSFGTRWLAEQLRWTFQDQISQPYVLERHGMRPTELLMPGGSTAPLHGSGYVEWRQHRSEL